MSCNCKNGSNNLDQNVSNTVVSKNPITGSNIILRVIFFLVAVVVIGLLLLPVIIPMMVIMLFNSIVLKRGTDVTRPLIGLGKMLRTSNKRKNDVDTDSDLDDINPEEYELMDVEEVK
jgi:hypothetical protein